MQKSLCKKGMNPSWKRRVEMSETRKAILALRFFKVERYNTREIQYLYIGLV